MITKFASIAFCVVAVVFTSNAFTADPGRIVCVNQACRHAFVPEQNKAPMWDAMLGGGAAGGATGAGVGAWVGSGTGVAVGGWGAIPGWYVGTAGGWLFGTALGTIGGAWYRDTQVMCPACKTVFDNPKN